MPGLALTDEFFLSTATVMIGPQTDLMELNVAEHSLGLVKNFSMQSDPTLVELTQGIRNQRVATMVTGTGLKTSWEMYEYTAKNLAYAAGLDATGTNFAPMTAGDPLSIAADETDISVTVTGSKSASYPVGSWIYIQRASDDFVHIAKVTAVVGTTDTEITFTGNPLPFDCAAGTAKVGRLNKLNVGADNEIQYHSMKVVGLIPKGNKPLILMFPKVQIVKGLAINFATDNFSNMPFEANPYQPTATDVGYSLDWNQEVHILRQ